MALATGATFLTPEVEGCIFGAARCDFSLFEEFAAAGGYDFSLFKQLVAGVVAAAEHNFSLLEDIVEAGLTPAASITRGAGSGPAVWEETGSLVQLLTPDCGDDFKVLFDDKVIEVCCLLPTSTC